jgi:hypothetical protein
MRPFLLLLLLLLVLLSLVFQCFSAGRLRCARAGGYGGYPQKYICVFLWGASCTVTLWYCVCLCVCFESDELFRGGWERSGVQSVYI